MLDTTTTAHPIHIVLPHPDPRLGQVMHLMRPLDAHIGRRSQVCTAPAAASRAVRHRLIRDGYPRHRSALSAVLLTPLATHGLRPLRRRFASTRQIIAGRRHRRVGTVATDLPLQLPDPLLQPGVRLQKPLRERDQLIARQLLATRTQAKIITDPSAAVTHRHADDLLSHVNAYD
jgi:hypothetical protein